MKSTVIYHSADFDGIFCREIAKKFLPDATLIGWNHGDPLIPFPSEGTVYVLDLSPECFTEIPKYQERLIWIDHHKSAFEKFPAVWPGYRIDGVSACRLAWQWFALHHVTPNPELFALPDKEHYFDRQVKEPLAVRLAGEYDIWDKRDSDADLFQHGLRSEDLHSTAWDDLLDNDGGGTVRRLLNQGRAIQYAKSQENEGIILSYGFNVEFEGLVFLACNHARFNSHLFTAGIKPEHDALFGFNWDGKKWRVSLYGIPGKDHDLSLIAVKYGGGGHKGACGFRTDELPFLK